MLKTGLDFFNPNVAEYLEFKTSRAQANALVAGYSPLNTGSDRFDGIVEPCGGCRTCSDCLGK